MDFAVMPIERILASYRRARALGQDHDTACAAAAQALGIEVGSVRDAVALATTEATS
jgi:hypothetical protein